jgi:hypothetical protein
MNILLIIFLAPIALFAGLIALKLFIRFFWVWAGLGLLATLVVGGYMVWLITYVPPSVAAYRETPEYKRQQVFDEHGNLRNP